MLRAPRLTILLVLSALIALPAVASAQVGVGIRMASVSGLVTADGTEQPAERWYVGGQLRLRGSRTGIELSIDRHTTEDPLLGVKTTRTPFQMSLLLFMTKSAIAPYLIGGIGWYSQKIESLNSAAPDVALSTREFGYHLGIGGEVRFGKHAAAHIDYRWTKVHFGNNSNDGTSNGGINIPGLGAITDKLGISSDGSMWTTGLTVYF